MEKRSNRPQDKRAQSRHTMAKRTGIVVKKQAQGISNPFPSRLLPLKKAAEYLGLTTWAMRERIWKGEIPVFTYPGGRKQFIDTEDIEAFIQRNKRVIT